MRGSHRETPKCSPICLYMSAYTEIHWRIKKPISWTGPHGVIIQFWLEFCCLQDTSFVDFRFGPDFFGVSLQLILTLEAGICRPLRLLKGILLDYRNIEKLSKTMPASRSMLLLWSYIWRTGILSFSSPVLCETKDTCFFCSTAAKTMINIS